MGKIIPKFHFILVALIVFSFVPFSFSAIKEDAKRVKEFRDKGYDAQRKGNLDMALSYYQKAIEANPYYAMVYNDIGVVFEAKGMTERAKKAYLKALTVDPNYLSAYYNLAALYEKEGEIDQAAYYWRMRINLGDWSDVWTWRANEHLERLGVRGELDVGKLPVTGDLGFGLTPNPKNDAQYHLNRGRRYLGAGKYIAALKEFNAAIVLDPRNKEIKDLLEDAQRKVLLYN
ncbi:tetratricopeptide repeat protein [Candidatus Omnitrophota bacterium]